MQERSEIKKMKKKKTLVHLIWITLILLTFAKFVYTTFYSPESKHRKKVEETKRFCDYLTSSINKNVKFKDIRLSYCERETECILVMGTVKTDKDLLILKEIIELEKPPIRVIWVVKVNPIKTKNSEPKNSRDAVPSPQI